MNDIISWSAQHNTVVIQIIFSIVLLLILVYVYRLFFVNSSAPGSSDSSAELTEVNQKLDQLLEQQKNSGIQVIEKVVPAADADLKAAADAVATASPPSVDQGANAGELDQAKAENAKLKGQLNELEKKLFELTPLAGAQDASKDDSAKVDHAQLVELNKKVEELQSRLSEYDIIADDIAELSQLRAENAELKKKIENPGESGSSGEGVGVSSPEPEPVAAAASEPEAAAVSEAAKSMESIVAEASTSETNGVPGFDAETSALLDSLVAETDAAAQAAAAEAEATSTKEAAAEVTTEEPKIAMDQNIPENEKNLINEFEKSIQKGS